MKCLFDMQWHAPRGAVQAAVAAAAASGRAGPRMNELARGRQAWPIH